MASDRRTFPSFFCFGHPELHGQQTNCNATPGVFCMNCKKAFCTACHTTFHWALDPEFHRCIYRDETKAFERCAFSTHTRQCPFLGTSSCHDCHYKQLVCLSCADAQHKHLGDSERAEHLVYELSPRQLYPSDRKSSLFFPIRGTATKAFAHFSYGVK